MSTTSRDRTAAGLAALLVAASVALTGCGDGDDTADAHPRPTSSSSGSASPSAGASSGTGVAAATGEPIDTSYFTVRVPERYRVDVQGRDFSYAVTGPAGTMNLGIISDSGPVPSLPQLAREERAKVERLAKAPLGATTTIDGEPAYLLVASGPTLVTSEAGLYHGSHLVYLTIDTYGSRAQNLRILRSMLASWQWK